MSRFSPLRYLCLLVVFLVASWLLLAAVFALLPAFPYSWDADPREHLQSGAVVTRVYRVADWFSRNDQTRIQKVHGASREFFAITWKLEYLPNESKSRLLLDSDRSIDLNYYWNRAKDPTSHSIPFFTSQVIPAAIKLGDADGIILPWFRHADAALLFWEIHHETILVPLRLRVEIDRIEVWIDSSSQEERYGPWTPCNEPLLTLYNFDCFNSTPIEIKFPDPMAVENSSPSRTFTLRKGIQTMLVPVGLFIYHHSGFVALGLAAILGAIIIAFKLLAVYSLIVFVCWVGYGKPAFSPWFHTFWMTQYLAAMLPRLRQDSSVPSPNISGDEEVHSPKRRPQPLRGVRDFFRSTSPLDDLFVTFEFTRYMIEPIQFRRGLVGDSGQAQVTGVPNNIKFNVLHLRSGTEISNQRQQSDLEKGNL